jgi:glucans biosynthesis protein
LSGYGRYAGEIHGLTRRFFMAGAGVLVTGHALAQSEASPNRERSFDYQDVIDRARAMAQAPFDDRPDVQPPELAALDYDDYRKIRFREDARLQLGGGAFRLDLFHRGNLFKRRVGVNVLRNGKPVPVPYLHSEFDFGGLDLGDFPETLGFAGFRMRTPLNRPDVFDELIVFLGASYFRFLGRDQLYGLSARAFAINAGVENEREEFPFFREFWIEEAPPGQQHITILGLLDSPSLAGAFRFVVHPAEETFVDVTATVIPRTVVKGAGVAPLTSMYYTGASGAREIDLYRAEVHDSDGLLTQRDGVWSWRPLQNPLRNEMTSFPAGAPQGFGLLQRNREFDSYQDLEAAYELRPSYFVQPHGDWGAGAIELAELTTRSETNDNIVASFRPATPLQPLQPATWQYRITAMTDGDSLHPLAKADRTMVGDDPEPRDRVQPGSRVFVIDFAGDDLAFYKSALDQMELTVTSSLGKVTVDPLEWNPHLPGIRARVIAFVEPGQTTEIGVTLMRKGRRASETWLHRWSRLPA